MFTGIIEQTGRFAGYGRNRSELAVEAPGLAPRIGIGGSLAVDGACLSVVRRDGPKLVFDLSRETSLRTTLGDLRPGRVLNLELPLTPSSPIDGHLVTGHVDFRSRIVRSAARPPGRRLVVALPRAFAPFVVAQGSVAVNGVSLTVAAVGTSSFEIELIPITLDKSTMGLLRAGDEVNVECDLVGKYVYNFVSPKRRRTP